MKYLVYFACLLVLTLSGCATIFAGSTQTVSYDAQPPGTEVWVNGQLFGVTPLKLDMRKGQTYIIEFRKNGYNSTNVVLSNTIGVGWIVLDVFFWPSLLIDWGTGAWSKLNQDNVNAVLTAQNSGGNLAGPPAPMGTGTAPAASMTSLRTGNYVAVMPLQAKGIPQAEADLVTEALASKIQNRGRFRIMERGQMDNILGEQGFQSSGACDNTVCAVEIGKLLSIDLMVVGSMGKLGNSYMLNARLVNVETAEIVANSSKQIRGDLSDLGMIMDQVAMDLSRQ